MKERNEVVMRMEWNEGEVKEVERKREEQRKEKQREVCVMKTRKEKQLNKRRK